MNVSRDNYSDQLREDNEAAEARGYKGLWSAVILQAVIDAKNSATTNRQKADRQAAIRYLCRKSKDFTTVCHLAGFEPEYVRDQFKKAAARGFEKVSAKKPRMSGIVRW